MDKEKQLSKTKQFIKEQLGEDSTGHDYWHSLLVWRNAKNINETEKADDIIVELASLLHDVGDWKFQENTKTNRVSVNEFLESLELDEEIINHIQHIIENMSFKGEAAEKKNLSKEGQIVQDADRLESLGAIGLARTFATGQKFGQAIYDPELKPATHLSAEEYAKQYVGKRKNTTINHFYEKLLLLKDQFNTTRGKELAEGRHQYLLDFLEKFFAEWEGKE